VFFEYTDGDDLIDVVIFGQQHVEGFHFLAMQGSNGQRGKPHGRLPM
jgi:hypothetical protein